MTRQGRARDRRDIATVVADAAVEHEYWLKSWQRALICGVTQGPNVVEETAHLTCRFGSWLEANKGAVELAGDAMAELARAHREVHEAVRYLAGEAAAGHRLAPDEFDTAMDAAVAFNAAVHRVRETHGAPEDMEVPADAQLAELQSRMTMLGELERERERALRTGAAMSLVLVHPEPLQAIEAGYGTVGIDRAVAGLAARLFSQLRSYDGLYRYGRSEFLLCLPASTAEQARGIAERLAEAVGAAPMALSDTIETEVYARFGIAVVDARATIQETVDRALHALAMTGTGEGQRIVVWAPEREN